MTNPEIIYAGSDGGIYRSENGGISWDDTINKGLCITQFEFMEQDPVDENFVLAGTQDNGTIRYEGKPEFYHSDNGDGGFTCIDPTDSKNVWHTAYCLSPLFSNKRGEKGSWIDVSIGLPWDPDPLAYSNFYPPMTLCKTNPNNISIGGRSLYVDNNKGKRRLVESYKA